MSGGLSLEQNIGEMIATKQSVYPQAPVAGTVNGSSFDRLASSDAQSCQIHHAAGASTGAPTSFTVMTVIQDSADNAAFANYTPPGGVAGGNLAVLSAANTDAVANINLTGARRFVRLATTVAFVGGTAPTQFVSADIAFGGEQEQPAV